MNLKKMKINNLRLKDIMKEYDVTEQTISYAGIDGVAELLGWQINFFRKKEDLMNTVAIWFFDIADTDMEKIANILLERIGIEIQFGKKIKVEEMGVADFVDEIIEDTIRYGYILSSNFFISIGLKNEKLSYLEIVNDEAIIKEIISSRI